MCCLIRTFGNCICHKDLVIHGVEIKRIYKSRPWKQRIQERTKISLSFIETFHMTALQFAGLHTHPTAPPPPHTPPHPHTSNDLTGPRFSKIFEPAHDKTYKMTCAPSQASDQPGHPPSQIRVFAVRMKKAWVLSYPLNAQQRLWSDWADVQTNLSLRWAHMHFVGIVMRRFL